MVRQRGQETAGAVAGIWRRQEQPTHVTWTKTLAEEGTFETVLQAGQETTGEVDLQESMAVQPARLQRTIALLVPQKLHVMSPPPEGQILTLRHPAHDTEILPLEGGGGVGHAFSALQDGHFTCDAAEECVITCWHW
mmetsp:Transcript_71699/g.149641  ORF Transcript_71699/g.149641 Transcript_71699/m.149641 type:complete len:137 (+) Transcript_71699:386-796(+)